MENEKEVVYKLDCDGKWFTKLIIKCQKKGLDICEEMIKYRHLHRSGDGIVHIWYGPPKAPQFT